MHKGLLVIGAAGVLAVFIVRSGGDTPAPQRAEAAVPEAAPDSATQERAMPAPRRSAMPRPVDGPAPISRRRDPLTSSLLEGIELSAEQEVRLEQIRTAQLEQEKHDREYYAATARQSRGRNRTLEEVAANAARLRELQDARARRQEGNIWQIRGILTFEQALQFDNNLTAWKAARGDTGH